jgi:hypothetical protein
MHPPPSCERYSMVCDMITGLALWRKITNSQEL